ncbi:lysozyme inhibitor LprI family protein [Wenyingzhuangia sp. chi5]|uniref:Lysozyme inhibitor LprI family protein n=1 Tax=Wenyingzhuangia gilva TaxID=3057677 RepID=A0ABT8VVP7_9FLAO|nr:lysozyme inhibitor LprI family protein [Wenyingzhuangia sp. chi5]MDO3696044.1 lysozyme inhibitor LprI family protein [Wenyingzhuangia sp. chi5]
MKKIISIFAFIISLNVSSQDFNESLKKLETENQKCLDKGKFMYECSLSFYKKSDSLLNVVYKQVRKKMNSAEKDKLKNEQLKWLKIRNQKFENINNSDTRLGNGLDNLMIKEQEKAVIVNERTKYLILKFKP